MKLNLGCCDKIIAGYSNVDLVAGPGVDVVADLSKPWLWSDSSVDAIIAHDIIEHLPRHIHTMNELHRVLRPGGIVDILVPSTAGHGAFQDPTHVSYWNENSFAYYCDGFPEHNRFARSYGITARFQAQTLRVVPAPDNIVYVHAVLVAVK